VSKYEPLSQFLTASGQAEVPMSFSDIERVIAAPLPPAAFRHRAWWSNNPSNSAMTRAWVEAGYKSAQVDMKAHRLVFLRLGPAETSSGTPRPLRGGLIDRLRRTLGGTVTVAPGVDLTQPTGEVWEAEKQ